MRESQQMSQMTQNQSWESSTAADEQEEDISCDESNSNNTVSLKPTIGLFGSVMIIVGTIIGSGIFVSPGGVHHCVESVGWSLVIWIVCGLFSAVGAYCYAELGTFIRESGGDYAYVLAAFGPLCGFLRMWIESIIIRPCSNAAVAITFATYILQPFYAADCPPPSHAVQLLAAAAILLLSLFNCKSVPFVTWIQDVFTVAKLCALALIIITGMVLLIHGAPYRDSFANAFVLPEDLTIGKIAMAFYFGLWAYDGWNYLNFITEVCTTLLTEMLNPLRDLPWAIFISCAICTLFYVLVNIAFYAGTSPKEFVDSKAIAVTFANKFYGPLAFTMPIMVAASCFGSINGVMLTSSRIFFVAGRNEHMPSLLSYINPYWNTPIPAVLFTGVLSMAYLLLSDNINTLITYIGIVNWLAIGAATAALLWLRFQSLKNSLIGLGLMLSGLPVYFLFVHRRFGRLDQIIDNFTLFTQKLLLVVPVGKKN